MAYVLPIHNLLLPLLGLSRRLGLVHALYGISLLLLRKECFIELYLIVIPDMPLESAALQ